jgi:hypothetical protein
VDWLEEMTIGVVDKNFRYPAGMVNWQDGYTYGSDDTVGRKVKIAYSK